MERRRGDRTLDPGEAQAPLRGSFQRVQAPLTRTLQGGDTVGSLRVVAVPGHTPGHIALFDPRDRSLIAGDAFQTAGGVAVASASPPPSTSPARYTRLMLAPELELHVSRDAQLPRTLAEQDALARQLIAALDTLRRTP